MSDDLVKQSIEELRELMRCRCHPAYTDRGLHNSDCMYYMDAAVNIVADRIKELEAERDALGEAVEIYRGLARGAPVGASDGQTFAVRFVTPKEFEAAILARAAELKGEKR